MHILEKCLMFVFCQRQRRVKDQQQQQIPSFSVSEELVEQQEQPPQLLEGSIPGRRILLLESGTRPGRRASHSPAQLETLSICADVHQQPDVVPEPERRVSKRHSGIAIEDDIEVLAPVDFKASAEQALM